MTREIVVFFSYDNPRPPAEIAQEMVQELRIGRAERGVDLLMGGVEVRLYFDADLLTQVRAYLSERGILHDISLL